MFVPIKIIFVLIMVAALVVISKETESQMNGWPQTRAEHTNYRETSHYGDVVDYLNQLMKMKAPIHIHYIGTSAGGRKIPLVIVSRNPKVTPSQVRSNGKIIVYIQANIHAGEVEGKEAVLMLIRQLAQNDKYHLLDRIVLLITPIYNIDGNEKFGDGKVNRSSQDGPDLVGERANGQGLDLNRDCMKAESPEMRAVLESVYTNWQPDVVMDLHTTNGTRHGFQLTYSPPLNPNTDPGILGYTRDELLPRLRSRLHKEKQLELFDYGNVERQNGERAWYTFGEEGRYVTNYVGLRNMISILSEAASFLPFKTRVESTLVFVEGILHEVAKDAPHIRALIREADERTRKKSRLPNSESGVRFEMVSRGVESITLEKLPSGAIVDHRTAPKELETLTLPIYDRFRATRKSKFPAAYLIPAAHTNVIDLMKRHGIRVDRLSKEWTGEAEEFVVSELVKSSSPFQGHRLNRLEGNFRKVTTPNISTFPKSSYLVSTAQPLGNLVFTLLEPEGLDGVAAWNFLDEALAVGQSYPIRNLFLPDIK